VRASAPIMLASSTILNPLSGSMICLLLSSDHLPNGELLDDANWCDQNDQFNRQYGLANGYVNFTHTLTLVHFSNK